MLLFFREPRKHDDVETASLAQAGKNFLVVLSNPRFMLFLAIFTGYWIVYWQLFITLPLYVHDYINPLADTERLLATGPLVVIASPSSSIVLMQKVPAFTAIILGTLLTSLDRFVIDPGSDGRRRGADAGRDCPRRDHAIAALLRIHLAPGAARDSREPTWASRFCRWAWAR